MTQQELLAKLGISPEDEVFTIVTSGHGSRFRYEGMDPCSPPEEGHLSLAAAIEKAQYLEGYGDTIGLRCQVVHVDTAIIFWPHAGKVFEPKFGSAEDHPGAKYGLG